MFMKDDVNMFSAKSDMSDARKIASLANRVYWIQFSPDGTRIRFTQEVDQFAHRSFGACPAAVEYCDAVANILDVRQEVAAEKDRLSALLQL